MIDLKKTYKTRSGRKVRLLCINVKSKYSVAGLVSDTYGEEVICAWTEDGIKFENLTNPLDLVEDSPYADWPIDAPVWARFTKTSKWVPRHFAGINDEGRALTFTDGHTSHTTKSKPIWWSDVRLASEFTPAAEETEK
ncbi:MAG: hypothetical protein HC888_07420 [Candidatus Competibacteraceae bacterium]|nr:hypothetical protein [Candidatus Competibacteraceae bacterium]